MKSHLNCNKFFACVVCIACISCHSTKHGGVKKLPGKWQATPIVTDGKNTDWPSPYPNYDDKAQLGYAISNDNERLYITIETGDPATQLKILRNGLTVWIDKQGEENKQTAINYPIPENRDETKPAEGMWLTGPQDKQRMDLEDKIRAAMIAAGEYSLQGFKSCNLQYAISETDSCGIKVHIGMDADNELIWEAEIPFKAFYYKPVTDKRDKGKPLSIGIETVGLKRPAGQPAAGRSGYRSPGVRPGVGIGMGGMGMGMNMGGGRGGRGRTAPAAETDITAPMYKSTMTWKKFGIATE